MLAAVVSPRIHTGYPQQKPVHPETLLQKLNVSYTSETEGHARFCNNDLLQLRFTLALRVLQSL
jgi:hypothetical protein